MAIAASRAASPDATSLTVASATSKAASTWSAVAARFGRHSRGGHRAYDGVAQRPSYSGGNDRRRAVLPRFARRLVGD